MIDAFGATSLYTLVQMVENGLGITLMPQIALDAGILRGTRLVHLSLAGDAPNRRIALVWRRGTARRAEFELLAKALRDTLAGRGPAKPR